MDTITITFPEVKVKIPIKDLTFDIIENMLFEILQNIARKVFEKAITDIDNYPNLPRFTGHQDKTIINLLEVQRIWKQREDSTVKNSRKKRWSIVCPRGSPWKR